jgi:hypothetical protein
VTLRQHCFFLGAPAEPDVLLGDATDNRWQRAWTVHARVRRPAAAAMDKLNMWVWLEGLSQGQAAFLGSLTGALIGPIALLLGALFNAHLNRRRDNHLRREDQRAVATALKAELAGLNETFVSNTEKLKDRQGGGFLLPALDQSERVLPHMLPKVGLLDPETIQSVIQASPTIRESQFLAMSSG